MRAIKRALIELAGTSGLNLLTHCYYSIKFLNLTFGQAILCGQIWAIFMSLAARLGSLTASWFI
jgi:hypothetical protein